jgi:tryptophan-rich sensory protein
MAILCFILFIIGGLSAAVGWETSNHSPNEKDKKVIQIYYGIAGVCFFFLFIFLASMAGR